MQVVLSGFSVRLFCFVQATTLCRYGMFFLVYQLGRKHHKMIIAQWNVRTLLDRETTNRPESRTALVAM